MPAPEHLNTFVGRLATFEAPKQLTKRRASTTKKKTPTTVSWPHQTPASEDLARAGFYYTPTSNHPDNVTCFMCDRKLDGWEPEDNPALEHLNHAPDCAWAVNVCIPHRDADENEDPMSDRMVAARTATFAGAWPHEGKKGWKCKTKKMVEAGWCFDPSPEYEDGVACFYCMLSLDGWEPKDNPMEEHRKRSADCPFFLLLDVYAGAKKATKGKRSRASTASKTSRLSVQSSRDFDTFSEAPSLMSLGDDAVHEEDSVLTTASNATTASMPRGRKGTGKAKATTKGTRKTTRSKKATEESVLEMEPALDPADEDLSLGDLAANDEDSVMTTATTASTASKTGKGRKTAAKPKAAAKGTRKTSRATKKNAATVDSALMDEPTTDVAGTDLSIAPTGDTGRATRRTSKIETTSYVDQTSRSESHSELQPQKQRATRGKAGRKGKATGESRLSNDASQLQSELHDAVTRAAEPDPSKPQHGTKRMSDGSAKVDDSVIVLEDPPKPAKAKGGRKAKQVEDSEAMDVTEDVAPAGPPKAGAKPKRGRKPKQRVIEDSAVEPTTNEFSVSLSPRRESTPVQDLPAPAAEASPDASPAPRESSPAPREPSPRPREPTPPPKDLTPSPSPQSSDAENKPPSSRPASSRPALSAQAVRVPLGERTPQTSPSKRGAGNVIGGLSSAFPWQAVDLENIFLQSPSTKRLLHAGGVGSDDESEKENGNYENVSLDEAVVRVVRDMSSAEKKMTVEEWVHFRAEKGEQRLKDECERLVGIFETQGTRAMRALEGIECNA